ENQRFEEAERSFRDICDPTETEGEAPQRFWKMKPFFELFFKENAEAGPIHELLLLLQDRSSDPKRERAREDLVRQIEAWKANPFMPHAIARLRPTAYQKAVVMKYIDNLIAWADQLFRRRTMESINEATQLYVLVVEILGPRPERVRPKAPEPKTYNDLLAAGLDTFSNALAEIEPYLPEFPAHDEDNDPVDGESSVASGDAP